MGANPKRDALNRLAKVGPSAAARSEEMRPKNAALENSSGAPAAQSPDHRERLLLSVGEAASRLGIDKARLRLVLSHGQVSHRLVAKRADAASAVAGQDLQADTPPNQPERGRGVRIPVEILDDLRLLLNKSASENPPSLITERSALPVPLEEISAATPPPNIFTEPLQTAETNLSDAPVEANGKSIHVSHPERYAVAETELPGEGNARQSPAMATSMPLTFAFECLLSEKDARIDDLKAEIAHLRDVLEREQHAHARAQALLSLLNPPPAEAIAEPVVEALTVDSSASATVSTQLPTRPTAPPIQRSIWHGVFSRLRAR